MPLIREAEGGEEEQREEKREEEEEERRVQVLLVQEAGRKIQRKNDRERRECGMRAKFDHLH